MVCKQSVESALDAREAGSRDALRGGERSMPTSSPDLSKKDGGGRQQSIDTLFCGVCPNVPKASKGGGSRKREIQGC